MSDQQNVTTATPERVRVLVENVINNTPESSVEYPGLTRVLAVRLGPDPLAQLRNEIVDPSDLLRAADEIAAALAIRAGAALSDPQMAGDLTPPEVGRLAGAISSILQAVARSGMIR